MIANSPRIGAVILAAGKGTRMHSDIPKVLQPLLHEPMLRYVFDAVCPITETATYTVIGHRADLVRRVFASYADRFVEQTQQLGTGHALQCAWPAVLEAGLDHVLVINGDTPLISTGVLENFLRASLERKADIAFITLSPPDPGALGLVLREGDRVRAIIEAKDYDSALHGPKPREINAGIYCLRVASLSPLLPLLGNANKSGEFYITDLIHLGVERGLAVEGVPHGNDNSLLGINSPAELVRSEEIARMRIVARHLDNGVIIRAASSVRIGPDAGIEPGADLTGPCEIYGSCRIAAGVRIASHCRLEDTIVEAGAEIHSFSHLAGAHVGPGAMVGPYARLRPGAVLEEEARVGNFVEMKQARLGKKAKACHLTYLGDAEIGPDANIGAGTITCNFDGKQKHRTIIGEQAFIGSNAALVAPVSVGKNALVGAGSVITKDVPEGTLALARAQQITLPRKK